MNAAAETDVELVPALVDVARDEYPDLDVSGLLSQVRELALQAADRCSNIESTSQKVQTLNQFLFVECGFKGNHDEFYDPRNCYINEVMERRLGIPISLAVLQLECARACDLALEGVSFPGHFLVRVPMDGGLLVMDPFHRGRPMDVDELRQRARPHMGDRDIDDQQLLNLLSPASNRAIVARILRNLKGVYTEQEDFARALRCADRLIRFDASQAEDWRDRGLLYLQLGVGQRAGEDLARYLQLRPDAGDADAVREAMIDAAKSRVTRH
ncbi:SirB1 family protein [Pseudomarimonas arenosa]|nr:tetratricopeptide repeat protein [Pseudomarimonas arenosa]